MLEKTDSLSAVIHLTPVLTEDKGSLYSHNLPRHNEKVTYITSKGSTDISPEHIVQQTKPP